MTKKLYRHTAREADRLLWISLIIGVVCGVFTYVVTENPGIVAAVVAVPFYSAIRRALKGPPMGVPLLEVAEDMLVFRNPLFIPPKVDRIPLSKLHSVSYRGEEGRRFFDCLDNDGVERSIGPFERMPEVQVIARWFAETLPEHPFRVHVSVLPQHQDMPPGL